MAYQAYSTSQGPLGTSTFRLVGVTAPAQFQPSMVFSATQNSSGTNTNVKLDSTYPLLTEVDGVYTSANQFRMKTEFSALRSVIDDTERARIFDEHVQFLLDKRDLILQGAVV